MIKFNCYHCFQKISAEDHTTGNKTACPNCQGRIHVPHLTDARPQYPRPPKYKPTWSDVAFLTGIIIFVVATLIFLWTRKGTGLKGVITAGTTTFIFWWCWNSFHKDQKKQKENSENEYRKTEDWAGRLNVSVYDLHGYVDYVREKMCSHYDQEKIQLKKEKKRKKKEQKLKNKSQ